MKAREALHLLTYNLVNATDQQAEDVETILELGAGHLTGMDGELKSPAGLVVKRRAMWVTLANTLRLDTGGREGEWMPMAKYAPIDVGDWESVLLGLIVRLRFDTIGQVANDLRASHPNHLEEPRKEESQ
jgi:hypothetical protein